MKIPSEHINVLTHPKLWMDPEAVSQLERVASLPHCEQAVGMPDLHCGRGIPVGAAFSFRGVIRPKLIGGDMGCGVSLAVVPKIKKRGDALKRRLPVKAPRLFDEVEDPHLALSLIWHEGIYGLSKIPTLPSSLRELAKLSSPTPHVGNIPSSLDRVQRYLDQLGTPGGGNHFLEISRVAEVSERERCDQLGLRAGTHVVIAHSGSRGLGGDLSAEWADQILEHSPDQDEYLSALQGALNYARCNRFILQWLALNAMGCASTERVSFQLDLIHNEVTPMKLGSELWLHRKGAAPAQSGELTVVLGTRGSRSWLMEGLGDERCLCSVAHGAGRKMSRSEAVAKLKPKYTRQSLAQTKLGGTVLCDDPQLLYEEHPRAYKAIEPVIQSLEEAGAAKRIAALEPLFTMKFSEGHDSE